MPCQSFSTSCRTGDTNISAAARSSKKSVSIKFKKLNQIQKLNAKKIILEIKSEDLSSRKHLWEFIPIWSNFLSSVNGSIEFRFTYNKIHIFQLINLISLLNLKSCTVTTIIKFWKLSVIPEKYIFTENLCSHSQPLVASIPTFRLCKFLYSEQFT